MKNKVMVTLQVLVFLVIMAGTLLAISSRFVTKDVFTEFKEGTVQSLWNKINKMDEKLDFLVREQHGRNTEGQTR